MNNQELSREFDLMYNNINSNQSPGLNEYEKSLVLTEAQEAMTVGLYNGTLGAMSFEEKEEVTAYLASLVGQAELEEKQESSPETSGGFKPFKISPKSKLFELPENVMFITYEECTITDDSFCGDDHARTASVVPVTQDEYQRTVRNPFKGANRNRVLRLSFANGSDKKRYSELVSGYEVSKYKVRYIRKPSPIVLEDLASGLTIDGISDSTECSLPSFLHRKLLVQAVGLAKSFWS